MTWIILPNQLFDVYKRENEPYVIWEHPAFFTKYKFNKKKLILHRASMKAFYNILKNKNFKISYVDINQEYIIKNDDKSYTPVNKIRLMTSGQFQIDSPNFLLTNDLMKKYRNKTKHFRFTNFYMWAKNELNILPNQKSTDAENRKKPPNNVIDTALKLRTFKNSSTSNKYIV